MKAWLVYDRKQSVRNIDCIYLYMAAGASRGVSVELLISDELSAVFNNGEKTLLKNGQALEPADFCIFRSGDFFLHDFVDSMGVRTFNSAKLSRLADDKARAYALAADMGIPTLPTAITSSGVLPEGFSYPVVLKPRAGHGGKNVMLANTPDEYAEKTEALADETSWIVQECAADTGRDLRVYVLGGEPIIAMMRQSEDDFRSNFCLGGTAREHALTAEEKSIVDAIISSIEIDYAGIDMVYHHGKPFFNEIEDRVGARMLYTLTDVDPVSLYMDYMLNCLGSRS